jgi:hypothetical protein
MKVIASRLVLLLVLAFLLTAFRLFQFEPNEAFISFLALVAAWAIGILGPRPLDWIKKALKLEGVAAAFVVWAICTIVGVLGLFLAGAVQLTDFTWANALALGQAIFAAATLVYKYLNPSPQTP